MNLYAACIRLGLFTVATTLGGCVSGREAVPEVGYAAETAGPLTLKRVEVEPGVGHIYDMMTIAEGNSRVILVLGSGGVARIRIAGEVFLLDRRDLVEEPLGPWGPCQFANADGTAIISIGATYLRSVEYKDARGKTLWTIDARSRPESMRGNWDAVHVINCGGEHQYVLLNYTAGYCAVVNQEGQIVRDYKFSQLNGDSDMQMWAGKAVVFARQGGNVVLWDACSADVPIRLTLPNWTYVNGFILTPAPSGETEELRALVSSSLKRRRGSEEYQIGFGELVIPHEGQPRLLPFENEDEIRRASLRGGSKAVRCADGRVVIVHPYYAHLQRASGPGLEGIQTWIRITMPEGELVTEAFAPNDSRDRVILKRVPSVYLEGEESTTAVIASGRSLFTHVVR